MCIFGPAKRALLRPASDAHEHHTGGAGGHLYSPRALIHADVTGLGNSAEDFSAPPDSRIRVQALRANDSALMRVGGRKAPPRNPVSDPPSITPDGSKITPGYFEP